MTSTAVRLAPAATPSAGPAPGPECPDVLIIGGGPAGCAAAIVLAELGWAVTLLEKEQHPRFHIGESLLPMNMPILERLGVLEQVRGIGVLKRGADFPNDAGGYNTFRFSRALDAKADFAFQVPRAQFDQVLFARARAVGVDAREQVKVEQVAFDGQQPVLQARAADGQAQQFRPRYLLDASGRDTFLGNRFKLKRANARHQSAAVFSHFRGVTRRPGEDAGNISIYRHAHGWMWLIPLPDDITSVGAVCYPEYMKTRKGDSEGFFMRTLALNAELGARMSGAERVAPVHATGNYAYECTRMAGTRWLLLGDAYTFVDPMFSSGVFLAMHSAERGAAMVDAALRAPQHEAKLQRALQRELTRGVDEFKWFIYRFTSPTMRALFAQPQNVFQIEEAVVAMLAGDVFDSPKVRLRLRAFRAIYALTTLSIMPRAWHAWRHRRRQAKLGFDGDTLQRETQ
ncbi:FAD-dependent oxidoreductase [Xanthomonas sp. 3075]|uniref:NAD(P)/FAD-dependent oxidoreductase n=1 Tax=Xanthomonas sp. 3075 TaxID=3035315 RepID=UPI00160AB435|nr:FAD-dependent oxidoreductase [Xanthomonas sp. 3075]MBB4129852.1 flavin-dependent dehydrogenase [Xanthomonas sp. 3075]